jgi:outer membrane receptor protein involved in Fe transport
VGVNGIETRSTQALLSAEKPFTEESRWGATFSYTYTDADLNRNINEHYGFDQASIDEYPVIISNAAAKHRVVATGTFSAPWGLMLAGKLTWSTPIPRAVDATCLPPPGLFENGAPCTQVGYAPDTTTGYQSLDLQVTKNFEVGDLGSMYLRLDVINVTNRENLVDYSDSTGANGLVNGGEYSPHGNITGLPRTARMSFGVKF